jgi:hypothetical protein
MAEVVMRPIEALYFTAPGAVTDFLIASGLLRKMLHVILGNMTSTGFPAYFPVADNLKRDIVPVTFLSTVCRALTTNSSAVTSLLSSMLNGAGINNSDAVVVQGLVRYMVDKFDSASYRVGGQWHQRVSEDTQGHLTDTFRICLFNFNLKLLSVALASDIGGVFPITRS